MYDATLREGAQACEVGFSLQDKVRITLKLDELGVPFIEGGWPNSNPKDKEYFKAIRDYSLSYSKVVAFGSTRKKSVTASKDENLQSIVESDVEWATIFGKAWDMHVTQVLGATLSENLEMVSDSIEYLREHGLNVIFDAEHFYDGFKANREYALRVLSAAAEAGASRLVLCDTNGGTLPWEFTRITREVCRRFVTPIGVHCHNDSGVAVANSLSAVAEGAFHVQGTVNGIGERCGNADLCQVIPSLELKMGVEAIAGSLRRLAEVSNYVYEVTNLKPNPYQPYVGKYAFAHKGGVHIDAVLKVERSYEHVDPAAVGNVRVIALSEVAGRAAVAAKAREFGLELDRNSEEALKVLERIKQLENMGYQLENVNGTLYMVMLDVLGRRMKDFEVLSWRTLVEAKNGEVVSESTVRLAIGDRVFHEISEGDGPVHAQDMAIRKALRESYPEIERVKLINYKVTTVDVPSGVEDRTGTGATVRVYIEFSDGVETWSTVGVSPNILKATKEALIDGYSYYIHKVRLNSLGRNN
nr:citramalate synthase [Candidatus Freyrarchaeum guaymaensis]HDO80341.1 citramalate synthase [Candidatus Bathyarchaeota archaeon]